jgi:predicted glutamine amidotransferase
LTRPFTAEEVKKTVFSMKEDSAPGPDGFGVVFYKEGWEFIKKELMPMINDFYLGNLDINRLNYGVITLIPKIKGGNQRKTI